MESENEDHDDYDEEMSEVTDLHDADITPGKAPSCTFGVRWSTSELLSAPIRAVKEL